MAGAAVAMRIIRPDEHRIMAWKNGGGTTTEIAIDPPDAAVGARFRWRLSIADVAESGPFSAFPGYERTIMMIAGRGMELAVGGRPPHRIDRPFEPFVFSGDEPTACRLLDGPIRDFNLMVARTSARSHLEVRHLEGASRLHAPLSGDVIIHCFHGAIDLATSTGTEAGMLLSNCTAIVSSAAGGMPHDLRMIAAGGGAMIAIIEIAVNRGSVGDR